MLRYSHFPAMMTKTVLFLFVWLIHISQSAIAQVERSNEANTGRVPTLVLSEQPKLLWKVTDKNVEMGTLFGGQLYLSSSPSILQSLDVATGEEVWNTKVSDEHATGIACSKNPDFDFLVVTHTSGVAVLERFSGAVLWQKSIGQGLAGPVVIDETIYAAGFDGIAYALNLNAGNILWKHDYLFDAPDDPPGFDGERARFSEKLARPRPMVTDGETLYFSVFDQCRLIALDRATGKRKWAFNTKGWILARPAVGKQAVYIGSQDEFLYSINKESGTLNWKVKTGARVEASPAIGEDFVYFGSCDAHLYCLDKSSGEIVWKYMTEKYEKYGGPIYEQALICGDVVYLPTMKGEVYSLQASTGKLHWKFRPSIESQIFESFSDGKRLFLLTRKNFEDQGERSLIVLGE